MQVFKTYFKILKKQRVPIIIYSVMFLAITVAITSNIKVQNQQFAASKVKTMVINEDGQNEFIDGFLNYLGQYVTFVEPKDDVNDRKDMLFFNEVTYILTIPKGFTDQFLKDGTDSLVKETVPNSPESISVDSAVNNYLNMAKVYLKHVPNIDLKDLNTFITNNLHEQTPVTVEVKVQDAVTYSNNFNMNFFNYLGYIMISCFIIGVSVVMFSFNELDIRRKHSASPMTSKSMNLQLIFANFVFIITYMALFMIAGYMLNKDRMINTNTWLTWLNALVFAISVLSISYLIGNAVTNRSAVQAISTALSLSLAFISGIFVPQEFLSASVLKAASFTPAYWYVKANTAIVGITSLKWDQISDILGYMGIELGFAVAIFSISLVVSKRKRQQII